MSQPLTDATFDAQTGQLRLRANISAGLLDIQCQQVKTGNDSVTVVQGAIAGQPIYRAFYSYDSGRVLFVQLKDADVGMTVVFSDDGSGTGTKAQMTVIHDEQFPQTFTIDKSAAVDKRDLQAAIVGGGQQDTVLDLVGRRQVPNITPGELYDTFGTLPGLIQFLGGAQPEASHFATDKGAIKESAITPETREIGFCWCALLCLVPACGIACLLCSCVRGK